MLVLMGSLHDSWVRFFCGGWDLIWGRGGACSPVFLDRIPPIEALNLGDEGGRDGICSCYISCAATGSVLVWVLMEFVSSFYAKLRRRLLDSQV